MPPTTFQPSGPTPGERGLRSLELLRERFRVAELPGSFSALAASEAGISDLYMNLNRQLSEGRVPEKTKLLVAAAVAASQGGADATAFFTTAAVAAGWQREDVVEAIAVASTCSVFNGYYRFRHQIPAELKPTYEAFRAPFNANTFMKNRLDAPAIEAICIVVSSVNDCTACVEGHVNKGRAVGLTHEQIDELIKAGAVAAATARVLAAMAALAP